jgi:hypothetical protein
MTPTDDMDLRRRQLLEVTAECDALRAQLAGDIPAATAWLQAKVWRQRLALEGINRRVENQRFVLRTVNELGRGLTAEEYRAARDAAGEQLRGRIDEPAAYAAAG